MLISLIELKNFGIFNGRHELNLMPSKKGKKHRPIALIGGKNGAGKSTIFEAIKLCLYGAKSVGEKSSALSYESYLHSRINWFTPDDETTSVRINFKVFRENSNMTKSREYEYEVVREWISSGKRVKEELSIYEDGERLDVDQIFWQDFIEEIIPQGVVDLFFFDGEKIQKLAEGSNKNLKDAIKSLLNLSIIPSLSSDLQMIYSRYLENEENGKASKELVVLRKANKKIEEEILSDCKSLASFRTQVQGTQNRIKSLEDKLKKEGAEYYSQRDELKKEQAENSLKTEQAKQQIGKMCEEHIPFMLFPGLTEKVIEQLHVDMKYQEGKLLEGILIKKTKSLNKAVRKIAEQMKLSKEDVRSFCDKVSGYTASWTEELSSEKGKYGLPPHVIYQSLEMIDKVGKKQKELFNLFDDLEKMNRYDKKLEAKVERSLESNTVLELHKKIKQQSQILGSQENRAGALDDEMSKKRREIDKNEKKIKTLEKLLEKTTRNSDSYKRIGVIKKVLSDFESKLTKVKLGRLEDEIYNCYSKLHRKTGFIGGIQIDPEDFEVTMFDRSQRAIPLDKLSAGEKQIYAISVLWALARMSGKALPMIIDTPLGRLDEKHREYLVENFFPNASHQVVILSTDTEIDEDYFQDMKSHISRTYNIDFNTHKGFSNVNHGYFFVPSGVAGGVQ